MTTLVLFRIRAPMVCCYCSLLLALFPGLLHLQFRSLTVCKKGGRRPGESYHVIHSTPDVMDSRCNGLFTLFSTAIEKIDKLQRRSRSYL